MKLNVQVFFASGCTFFAQSTRQPSLISSQTISPLAYTDKSSRPYSCLRTLPKVGWVRTEIFSHVYTCKAVINP